MSDGSRAGKQATTLRRVGLSEHLRVIWRRRWRVLAAALLLAGVVYLRSSSQPEVYRADVLLSVTPGRVEGGAEETSAFLARTYAALAGTRPVVAAAVPRSGLRMGATDALALVDARPAATAGFLTIRADGSSTRSAEQLAQAVADSLVETVRDRQQRARDDALAPATRELTDLEQRLAARDLPGDAPQRALLQSRYQELLARVTDARLRPADRVDPVTPARASTAPVAPTPARDALIAFLAALAANALLAVLIEALSDRFSTENPAEEATRVTGLPVLAQVPRTDGAGMVEAFRSLRTSLMFMSTSERLRTLAVVSVDPGSGKTFTALNLAREAAALGAPVVLIDGDLRRPVVHHRVGLERSPGLSEALVTGENAEPLAHSVEGWLRVLPSGGPVADPAGLFGGRHFRQALEAMTWAELVVVDTPAASLFADAMAIASQCDATLVVVDAQASRRRPVRHLVENLRRVSAEPIGLVLNRTEAVARPSYYDSPPPEKRRRPAS